MVSHPDPACRQAQQGYLATCPATEKRFHKLLFSYGNAAYRYHQRAGKFEGNEALWEEWLHCIPAPLADQLREQGYEKGKHALPFTRYVMEVNDIGMDAYVRTLMGEAEYEAFQKLKTDIQP